MAAKLQEVVVAHAHGVEAEPSRYQRPASQTQSKGGHVGGRASRGVLGPVDTRSPVDGRSRLYAGRMVIGDQVKAEVVLEVRLQPGEDEREPAR
jgi:hypothetical protein